MNAKRKEFKYFYLTALTSICDDLHGEHILWTWTAEIHTRITSEDHRRLAHLSCTNFALCVYASARVNVDARALFNSNAELRTTWNDAKTRFIVA